MHDGRLSPLEGNPIGNASDRDFDDDAKGKEDDDFARCVRDGLQRTCRGFAFLISCPARCQKYRDLKYEEEEVLEASVEDAPSEGKDDVDGDLLAESVDGLVIGGLEIRGQGLGGRGGAGKR